MTGTVRKLNLAGAASGNLRTRSTLIWSGPLTAKEQGGCFAQEDWPALISADGKTVSCMNYLDTSAGEQFDFITDPIPGSGAAIKSAFSYRVTLPSAKVPAGEVLLVDGASTFVSWVSATGDTLIGEWDFGGGLSPASTVRFGVISQGKVTPLKVPSSLAKASAVAW